ncbi:uncharacterized protein LOC143973614 [Lithobates pipiens]
MSPAGGGEEDDCGGFVLGLRTSVPLICSRCYRRRPTHGVECQQQLLLMEQAIPPVTCTQNRLLEKPSLPLPLADDKTVLVKQRTLKQLSVNARRSHAHAFTISSKYQAEDFCAVDLLPLL